MHHTAFSVHHGAYGVHHTAHNVQRTMGTKLCVACTQAVPVVHDWALFEVEQQTG